MGMGAVVAIGQAAKDIYKDFRNTFIPGAVQTQLEIENHLSTDLELVGSHVDAGRVMRLDGVDFAPPTKIPPKKKALILVDSTGGSSQLCVEYSVPTQPGNPKSERHMMFMYGYNPKMDADFYGGLWGRNINRQGNEDVARPVSYTQWRAARRTEGGASGNQKCDEICNAGDGPSGEGPWWEKKVSEIPTIPYDLYPWPIVLQSTVQRIDGSRLVCVFRIGAE